MTKYSYNSSTKYKITIEAEDKADSIFKELFDRFIKFNTGL